MKHALTLALLALLYTGCGQKGPLYLPPPEPAEGSQAPDETAPKAEESASKPGQPNKGPY